MKKTSLVLYQGDDFATQGGPNRFVKDVLRVGEWIHPITKQVVQITPERIRNLVKNTEAYRQTLDRKAVPFQDGHNFDAKKTLGWWTKFFSQGDRLYGVVEVTDKDAARKMEDRSIRSVSARIDPNVSDTKGGLFDEAFTHVCATPLAVLDGQQDFIKLSREDDGIDLLIPTELAGTLPEGNRSKEIFMLKKMALALGLPEGATEDQVEEAAKKALGAQKIALDQVKAEQDKVVALGAALKPLGFELKDGKVVKLSQEQDPPLTEREKALVAENATLKAAASLSRAKDAAGKAEELVKAGKVPPALQATLSRLLAVDGKQKALMLSKEGASVEEMVDVVNETLSLVKGLPAINTEKLSQEGDEESKADAAIEKDADELAKRTQPSLVKKA